MSHNYFLTTYNLSFFKFTNLNQRNGYFTNEITNPLIFMLFNSQTWTKETNTSLPKSQIHWFFANCSNWCLWVQYINTFFSWMSSWLQWTFMLPYRKWYVYFVISCCSVSLKNCGLVGLSHLTGQYWEPLVHPSI